MPRNWRWAPAGAPKLYEVEIDGRWELRNNPEGIALTVENEQGQSLLLYDPHPHQLTFHASQAPNVLALGTRGTGKSLMLRMDAILRCLLVPNFHGLVIRRTMPELRRSHLVDIEREMKLLGGRYLHTTCIAEFPNGSTITFAHCETEADILNFLSSQYGAIYFDELSTFTLNQFLQISAAARAPVEAAYTAVVRAGSNPLGIGAEWMKAWFVDKSVRLEDYPDYLPDEYEMQFSSLKDNPSLDRKAYEAKLKNLPEHIRRAWLLGEFVNEGAYFAEFYPTKQGRPWHVIDSLPTYHGKPLSAYGWLNVYRAVDWGYFPDPAVCLWFVVLPNKRAIAFKERTWYRTLAEDVARQIKSESQDMHVVETFCDPTMNIKTGQTAYSIMELFEQQGVPMTESVNKRELYGYAVQSYLSTLIDDEPQLQIVRTGCPDLLRTLPLLQMDKTDPRKLANGPDHWVVATAYFCTGSVPGSRDPVIPSTPRWMQPKFSPHALYAR